MSVQELETPDAVRERQVGYSVQPGYKQTEVGLIPKDWDVAALGDLTSLMTNGFVGTVKSQYAEHGNGVLYIQGYNIEENAFNFHGIKYVTPEFHRANAKSCLRDGDVLTVQTGEVGLTAVVPQSLDGSNCHALIISRFKRNVAHPQLMSQYLNSVPGRARLKEIETGTTMKHLNVGDMLHFFVPLPPLAEQEAIAEALGDADALVESLERLVAKKRNLKQAAMQQLLTGKKRLPSFEGKIKTQKVGELGHWLGGMTPSMQNPSYWAGGDFPWISSGDVKTPRLAYTSNSITAKAVKTGTTTVLPKFSIVVVNRSGILRKYLPVSILMRDMAINQDLKGLIPNKDVCPEFVFHSLTYHGNEILATCLKSGTTVESLELVWLKAFEIPLPTLAEQIAIAAVLSDMDAEIAAIEAKIDKARQIKAGMIQELLTGRTRLV